MNREQEYLIKNLYIRYIPESYQTAFDKVLQSNTRLALEKVKIEQNGISMIGALATQYRQGIWIVNSGRELKSAESLDIPQTDQLEKTGSLVIFGKAIQSIEIRKTSSDQTIETQNSVLNVGSADTIAVDFDVMDPILKAVLHFKNNIIDDFVVNFTYKLNPKNFIDPKIGLLEKLKMRHSLGEQLLNIYFQLANDQVEQTEIEIFVGDGRFDMGALKDVLNRQLISRISLEKNTKFYSAKDLAFGVYSYRLVQKDKNGCIIITSDFVDFNIEKPNYSGKRTIFR
jgi:hypothetical protein